MNQAQILELSVVVDVQILTNMRQAHDIDVVLVVVVVGQRAVEAGGLLAVEGPLAGPSRPMPSTAVVGIT